MVDTARFPAPLPDTLFGTGSSFVATALAEPDRALVELDRDRPGEPDRALQDSKGPETVTRRARRFRVVLERRSCHAGDRGAGRGGRSLTYGELDTASNRLAQHLRARGVEPGSRVAVALPWSLDYVVSVLGVLKAGGV